ncbi:transcriptional regulator [Lysinibacillus contaminans]|uniref:Transcriptional regulator n=1 Tax=Lysinibacillus contaminans TaxID=1293441 RepID=A0ABR5JXK5_9BACI|nr:polyprenyl synthetase family protein [Lysinibacillus contaminans]KOS66973.1 transcriptional regulator [Lysinibacillus contaminans]
MLDLHNRINESLDTLIEKEALIGSELRGMLKGFKEEKTDVGYSFGKLCIIHYEAFSEHCNEDIYKVAAAIELLILSFDIIDDLQDQDAEYSWSRTPDLSLNTAVAMLVMASKIIRESNFEHKGLAVQLLEKYALLSINGQQLDLLNYCRDEQSYLRMIEQKSGSLTAMSCLIGETLAKGEVSTQVEEYSKYIGIIQQIKNDIQDLKKWDRKNDLLNKKYTLPIIFLLLTENSVSKSVKDYYNEDIVTFMDNFVIERELTSSGAIRYALALKNLYKHKALQFLEDVTMDNGSKDFIKKLMK